MTREEQDIHRNVATHLRQRGASGLVWWHTGQGVKLGGKRNRKGVNIQGAIMRGLGVRAGVSDILAFHRGKFYALELKRQGGKPTDEQITFQNDIRAQGAFTSVADSLDDALQTLEFWGLLRGVAA